MLTRISSALNDVPLSKKGIAVVSIPIAVLMVTLLLTAWHEKESRNAQARITHSLRIKASLANLRSLVTDSETAVRGYLLWHTPVYLKPYNEAVYQIIPEIQNLSELVKDNSDQSSAVESIRIVVTEKIDILSKILDNPEITQDVSGPVARRGRDSMVTFRNLISEMSKTEQMLLQKSINEHDAIIRKN